MQQGSGSEAVQAQAAASGHETGLADVFVALAGVLPSLILVIAVCVLVFCNWPWIKEQLLSRLSTVKLMGVEVSFVKDIVNAALDARDIKVKTGASVAQRAALIGPVLVGARVLWVDADPSGNYRERRALQGMQVHIDLARTVAEATELLTEPEAAYHAIISNIGEKKVAFELLTWLAAREEEAEAAAKKEQATPLPLGMLRRHRARRRAPHPDVIVYVFERAEPVPHNGFPHELAPKGAFGVTTRPDELLHLTMDVLERRRSTDPNVLQRYKNYLPTLGLSLVGRPATVAAVGERPAAPPRETPPNDGSSRVEDIA
jgi:hypothetical protein